MLKENVINKYSFKINLLELQNKSLSDIIKESAPDFEMIYSYMVIALYDNDTGVQTGWEIDYNVSQSDLFNTIGIDEFIHDVELLINKDKELLEAKRVIGYRQPPLEIMLDLYEPLIQKLAKEQQDKWSLEFDDLSQMCRLCMCILYQNGYYVHKRLLQKTFRNMVLVSIRKDKYKPSMVSLYETFGGTGEELDKLTYADVVEDENALTEMYAMENTEADLDLLKKRKNAVINYLGTRTYEMLLNEYSSHSSSPYGRMIMYKVKNYFKRRKI